MPTNVRLAIPELEQFNPEELDNNPTLQPHQPVPLIGALLIDAGLITREQLNACLLLQAQDDPDTPIGQILLRCGYISAAELDRALSLQQELKASILDTIDARAPASPDLTALVLHAQGAYLGRAVLNGLGVKTRLVRDWRELQVALDRQPPDMIFISLDLIDDASAFPEQVRTPILILPPVLGADVPLQAMLPWARTLIVRFVEQVRMQQEQRAMCEYLRQREHELSIVTALSRSITVARSPRTVLFQLMVAIRDLFGVEAARLYRFDQASGQLALEVVLGSLPDHLSQRRSPIDRGIAGWVVSHGEPLLIPEVGRDRRFAHLSDGPSDYQIRSALCVPLVVRGEVRGVIELINKLGGEFNERDLLILRLLAALGALAEALDQPMLERDIGR
jgi:putative methionine-R-sulfoxide reductase with GAF domain